MKLLRSLALVALLPLAVFAQERTLKLDKTKSYVDVDVDTTVDFTAHLDQWDATVGLDQAGKPRTAKFTFRFADLKTGKAERDAKMIEWLGGGEPTGEFTLGMLAVTPDGQGQASGRLTFHGVSQLIEFPVNVTKDAAGAYTITGAVTLDTRNWKLKVIRMAMLLKVDPEVKVRFQLVGAPAEAAK